MLPRTLPDWIRSFRAARSKWPSIESKIADESARGKVNRIGTHFPTLELDSDGDHRCVGCDLCVSICPARCLQVGHTGEGVSLRVTAFEVARSDCIGCGACRDCCPVGAIVMSRGVDVEVMADSGRMRTIDLLAREG